MNEDEYYVEVALFEDLNNDNEVELLHLAIYTFNKEFGNRCAFFFFLPIVLDWARKVKLG